MKNPRLAIICYVTDGDRSLMIDRNNSDDFLFETIVGPGGGVEEGERSIDAVHREMREETGLVVRDVVYRGKVLFDHTGRDIHEDDRINHYVDIYCAGNFSGTLKDKCESGPVIWVPNPDIIKKSKWNGGDKIYQWLQQNDGVFDARIRHGADEKNRITVDWTGDPVRDNPYRVD